MPITCRECRDFDLSQSYCIREGQTVFRASAIVGAGTERSVASGQTIVAARCYEHLLILKFLNFIIPSGSWATHLCCCKQQAGGSWNFKACKFCAQCQMLILYCFVCFAHASTCMKPKTCRGAVVLLDNKLQDVPAKDNKPQAAALALPPWQSWQILADLA